MANPTTVITKPALIEATTTEQSIVLDPDREYTVSHKGLDTSGNARTDKIFMGSATGVVATMAASEDKLVLLDGRSEIVGPGWEALYFVVAAGGNSVTFGINPSPSLMGQY